MHNLQLIQNQSKSSQNQIEDPFDGKDILGKYSWNTNEEHLS